MVFEDFWSYQTQCENLLVAVLLFGVIIALHWATKPAYERIMTTILTRIKKRDE